MRTNIIVAGKEIDIGCPVITWEDEGGLSFYTNPKSLRVRNLSAEQTAEQIHCFVLHHSVTYKAKMTYDVLINRSLSCNFIIDDDLQDGFATIYQCADVKDACFSHNYMNDFGPGVEISYMPQAWSHPHLYNEANQKILGVQPHNIVMDEVHGVKLKCFAPTDAQIASAIHLMYGVCKACPRVLPEFPKQNGKTVKTTIKNPTGLLSHFMIKKEKVDPLGFPYELAEQTIKELLAGSPITMKSIFRETLDNVISFFKTQK